jgi:hypothetical protein
VSRASSRVLLLLLAAVPAAGCEEVIGFFREPTPDVDDPRAYSRHGLRFSYPGNWAVEEAATEKVAHVTVRTLNVESKGHALAVVQVYTPALELELDDYARDLLGGMNEELKSGWKRLLRTGRARSSDFHDRFLGARRRGRRIRLPIRLATERQPMTIEVRTAAVKAGTVAMMTIIADEDRRRVRPGFELIRASLRFGKGT